MVSFMGDTRRAAAEHRSQAATSSDAVYPRYAPHTHPAPSLAHLKVKVKTKLILHRQSTALVRLARG